MRDNGKEDARQMRDNEKEDARKRGGAFTIPILSMLKNRGGGGGGGRINDGGRSDVTLRYIYSL